MLFSLTALFTIIPALEIFMLFNVGARIGGLNTLFLILLTGFMGAIISRSQGLKILNNVQNELAQNRLPADEIIHGLLVFGGGLLLMTPGFFTDALGLSMVTPVSRHFWVAILKTKLKGAIASGNLKFSTFQFGQKSGGFYSSQSVQDEEFIQTENIDKNNVIEAEFKKKE